MCTGAGAAATPLGNRFRHRGQERSRMSNPLRRRFRIELMAGLKVVWPVVSFLLALMAGLGLLVAVLEGWPLGDGLYFAFVSGLTIGYGDLVPKSPLARVLAISIGLTGILLAGLVAAIGVQALQAALRGARDR
jgi:hypothetical protein